jgi:hypothetical protein
MISSADHYPLALTPGPSLARRELRHPFHPFHPLIRYLIR